MRARDRGAKTQLHPEFFAQLAVHGLDFALPRFDLSAGKFPEPGEGRWAVAARGQ